MRNRADRSTVSGVAAVSDHRRGAAIAVRSCPDVMGVMVKTSYRWN